MSSTALLHDRDCLFHLSIRFKVSQAYDCVRKITKVHGRLDGSDQSMLGENEQTDDALLVKIGTEFVQLVIQIVSPGMALR